MPLHQRLGGFGYRSAARDPHWSSVKSLLEFNGADGATSFPDKKGKVWTANGNAQLDTDQKKSGASSLLLDGTGDFITTPDHDDFEPGSSNFTYEFWLRQSSLVTGNVVAKRSSGAVFGGLNIYVQSSGEIGVVATFNGSSWGVNILSSAVLTTNAWQHIAFVRSGSSWVLYRNGTSVASTSASGTVQGNSAAQSIGAISNGDFPISGWIDGFRFGKGVARYTTSFTPPASPYPDW